MSVQSHLPTSRAMALLGGRHGGGLVNRAGLDVEAESLLPGTALIHLHAHSSVRYRIRLA